MKKIITYFFFAVLLMSITSCNDDDKYLFGQGPDERLQAKLTEYQNLLCNEPCGWLVAVGTQATGTNSGAYRMWMKFTQDNRVTMYSDQNATTAVTPQTSSYRLKAMQFPTLMFDTYNYLHVMADPSGKISGATSGSGLYSDFDFDLKIGLNGDELIATGRYNGCPVILKKATPQDTVAITSGPALVNIKTSVAANWEPIKYPTISVNGFIVQMSIGTRLSTFSYKDSSGIIQTKFIPTYAEFNKDVRLMNPFEYTNIKFDRIVWNGTKYSVVVNGSSYEVYDNGAPFYPLEFGVGKTYSKLTVNKSVLNTAAGSSMVDPFLTVYNTMYNSVAGLPRYIQYFTIGFGIDAQNNPQMTLTVSYTNTAGTVYLAYAYYKLNTEADGTVYFTNMISTSGNMNTVGPRMATNLLSYFLYEGTGNANGTTVPSSGNKFKIDWAPNMTPGLAANLAGFYVVSDPSNYVSGTLGN